ncbi:MAG: M23 family metallopeptidase, partial [Microbacterium sp.]
MGNHRADRTDPTWVTVAATPVGGARAAGRRKATRRELAAKPFRRIPAVPSIVGAFAIAAAASGAVTMGPGQAPSDASPVSFSGADAFSYANSEGPRAQAISRDTARQALEDKVDQELSAEVAAKSQVRNDAMAALAASAEKRADQIAKNLWVLPTEGYHLTARFGQSSGLWSHYHTGLDFAAPTGTPIFAVANGVIVSTGFDGAYGNKTVQRLADGTEIWYCHQNAIGVSPGDTVIQGNQIG